MESLSKCQKWIPRRFSFRFMSTAKIFYRKNMNFSDFFKNIALLELGQDFRSENTIFFKLRYAESSRAETLHTSSTSKEKYKLESSSQSKDMTFFELADPNLQGSLLNRFFWKKIEKFMFFLLENLG